MQETKRCSKCRKILPVSNFQRDRTKACGYHSQCKSCTSESRAIAAVRRKARQRPPEEVTIPYCCPGCIYYRHLGGVSGHGHGRKGCHYLLDTGHSRLKTCGYGICTVKVEGEVSDYYRYRNDFLF